MPHYRWYMAFFICTDPDKLTHWGLVFWAYLGWTQHTKKGHSCNSLKVSLYHFYLSNVERTESSDFPEQCFKYQYYNKFGNEFAKIVYKILTSPRVNSKTILLKPYVRRWNLMMFWFLEYQCVISWLVDQCNTLIIFLKKCEEEREVTEGGEWAAVHE